jgi:hypothetical protein
MSGRAGIYFVKSVFIDAIVVEQQGKKRAGPGWSIET